MIVIRPSYDRSMTAWLTFKPKRGYNAPFSYHRLACRLSSLRHGADRLRRGVFRPDRQLSDHGQSSGRCRPEGRDRRGDHLRQRGRQAARLYGQPAQGARLHRHRRPGRAEARRHAGARRRAHLGEGRRAARAFVAVNTSESYIKPERQAGRRRPRQPQRSPRNASCPASRTRSPPMRVFSPSPSRTSATRR